MPVCLQTASTGAIREWVFSYRHFATSAKLLELQRNMENLLFDDDKPAQL